MTTINTSFDTPGELERLKEIRSRRIDIQNKIKYHRDEYKQYSKILSIIKYV